MDSEDLGFTSVDVSNYIGVSHSELLRKLTPFINKGELISIRELESVKPLDGSRRRHAYKLTLSEFIYLVVKYHPKGMFGLSELFRKSINSNITHSEIFLRDLEVENFARGIAGLNPLDEDGKAIGGSEVENCGLTDEQLRAMGLNI